MADTAPDAITIVDTTEMRWFADGPLPLTVVNWFAGPGSMAVIEKRVDTYRIDGRDDAGLKRRFRRTLELKVRLDIAEVFPLEPELAAPLEEWRRWSPADDEVELHEPETWIDVHKVVYKRRFVGTGTEVAWASRLPTAPDGGCDVEVTSVRVGDVAAWTLALAAFGPAERRRAALGVAWRAIGRADERPDDLVPALREASGYPEWLNRHLSGGRRLVPENPPRSDASPERDTLDLV